MCAGAIYWSGIGRVVFALSGAALNAMVEGGEEAELALPCRDVFARGGRVDRGERAAPRGGRAGGARGLLGLKARRRV